MRRNFLILIALVTIASTYAVSMCGCSNGDAAVQAQAARADVLLLDSGLPAIELDRPPVEFPHDKHTDVMKDRGEDCTICHPLGQDEVLSLLYQRAPGADAPDATEAASKASNASSVSVEDLKAIYHEHCLDCHKTLADEGEPTGPVTCGECHRTEQIYTSSRMPIGFDKSLHYRHVKSQESKCENCHHEYDEDTETLIYVKGKEASCRDCHREQTVDNRSSFRLAAHSACIECHRKTTLEDQTVASGPSTCGGCHDPQRQAAIAVIEDPPRLEREQPDFVLLSAQEADLESSKLNTVPFSHLGHERATTTCRGCHHETLAPCSDCHTLWGDEKGANVTLQQAMHNMASEHSCVGCHNTHKSDAECAGCHDLMEQGRLTEHACNICHAGPSPADLEATRSRYESMDPFQPDPSDVALTFTADEIPDTVTIGSLAKDYPPVKMPHGQIVRKLSEHIEKSPLATHFHGKEDVVCQGCHHNGSIGRKPALCENCHREPFNVADLFRPGLYGAYHRQCMGCHVSMNLPKSSECSVCHEDKDDTTLGMSGRGSNR